MNLKICFSGVFLVLSCFDDNDFSDRYPSMDDLVVSLSVQGFRDRIDVINLFFVFESVVLCVAEIVVY